MNDNRKFILVTDDFSGLGFAKWGVENGKDVVVVFKPKEKPENMNEYLIQGKGIFPKLSMSSFLNNREKFKEHYIIFDGNHNCDVGELLRKEGFKVFGGSELQYQCENDREFGLEMAEEIGLDSPPHFEFKNSKDGIKFLEQNEDTAYVLKPNGSSDNAMTVPPMNPEPEKANLKIRGILESLDVKDFILQERIDKGVEVNVEAFVQDGEFVFASANLENKRASNSDLGKLVGCSFDICWALPLESKLFQMTVGLYEDYLRDINYTGLWDVNCIIADDKVYFLEHCQRIGYNAAPNLFSTILKKDMFDVAADLIDGVFEPEFRQGFGASLTLITDKPIKGLPIYIPENKESNVYVFDAFKEEDILKMGGLSNEIAIVTSHNYTLESAFEDCLSLADKVDFAFKDYRTDAHKNDYPGSPLKRYTALQAMKLL